MRWKSQKHAPCFMNGGFSIKYIVHYWHNLIEKWVSIQNHPLTANCENFWDLSQLEECGLYELFAMENEFLWKKMVKPSNRNCPWSEQKWKRTHNLSCFMVVVAKVKWNIQSCMAVKTLAEVKWSFAKTLWISPKLWKMSERASDFWKG